MTNAFYAFPSDSPAATYQSGQVTIGTTATLIGAFEGNSTGILISNSAGAPVFLGGPGVTTANGYQVAASAVNVPIPTYGGAKASLYGIVASTASVISFLHPNSGASSS